MADASYVQTSFLGGEWSQSAQGRFDTREYRTALNVCLNGIPVESGAWTRRPGTRHLGTTRRGLQGRVASFAFAADQPVLIEMTDLHFRFWNGTQLVMSNDGVFVSDISTANPAVVTTAAAHGWSSANEVQFQLPGTLCPLLQNRQFLITVLSPTTFSLQDDQSGTNIDGSTLGWSAPATPAAVTRVHDVGTLYTAGTSNSWENIRIVQAETTAVLLNGSAPYQLVASLGTPFPSFGWTPIAFIDGPYLDPDGSTMTPNGTSGLLTFVCSGIVNDGVGFTSADVGREIRFFSEPKPWPGAGTGATGDIVTYGGGYWEQLTAGTAIPPGATGNFAQPVDGLSSRTSGVFSSTGLVSAASPAWLPRTVGSVAGWRWARIAEVVDAITIKVTIDLVANTTINTWRLGVYGGPNGYPTCGCYHEGRLWLSGAIPNRVDASSSNDLYNFAPSLSDGTVLESSAIAATFNSNEVNPIFWMASDERGVICGTQYAEWLVSGSSANAAISPTNIQARPMTKNGCANIEPRRTENTLAVVHKYKRKILEFFADVYSGRYSAPNLSRFWKHITQPLIAEIAYQQELAPILWMRMEDGSFAGSSYKRDSLQTANGPEFSAGHRHTLGSGWTVASIATGSNNAGTLDALAMVTYDSSTNLYHVEQMADLWDEGTAKSRAWYLDSGVVPTSAVLTSDSDGNPVYQLNGLHHLNNYSVTAYIGGLDCGESTVTAGTMNVPLLSDPDEQFTSDFLTAAAASGGVDVLVGFTFNSDGQLTAPQLPTDTGARNGPGFAKKRRQHAAGIQLVDAYGVEIGTDFDHLKPIKLEQPNGSKIDPFDNYSGIIQTTIDDDNSFDSMICWRISRPFPCTLAAIGGFIQTSDR